jgi:lysophospholipase L1-like esterase
MENRFVNRVCSHPARPHPGRRALAPLLLAVSLALPSVCTIAQAKAPPARHWTGTWGAAPASGPQGDGVESFSEQTVRLIVHTSVGGTQVRIRLSNEFGSTPMRVGAAHIALRKSGADIVPGSDRVLSFGGQATVTLAPGAPAMSDPIDLDVPAMADLAVSLYLPEQVKATTVHAAAHQTSYVSPAGDFSGKDSFVPARTIGSWPFLTEVDVAGPAPAGVLLTFGDSITDGSVTTPDTNRRWPDLLARRLLAAGMTPAPPASHEKAKARTKGKSAASGAPVRLGIVNRGIGGNRLLRDPSGWPPFGKAGLARFDRDVLAVPGVRYVTVLIGINDIGHPAGSAPAAEAPTAQELIAGYRQLIARAHAQGVAIFGATMTPFEGTTFAGYYTPEKDAVREAVNQWMRSSGEFDAVLDFDRAVRDPEHPARLLPAYDSGDHLHPNDQGMQALANAVPLELFRTAGRQ